MRLDSLVTAAPLSTGTTLVDFAAKSMKAIPRVSPSTSAHRRSPRAAAVGSAFQGSVRVSAAIGRGSGGTGGVGFPRQAVITTVATKDPNAFMGPLPLETKLGPRLD